MAPKKNVKRKKKKKKRNRETIMPIPTPNKGESQSDFHSRCMGDDTIQSEFKTQDQRNGVCYSQWRKVHGAQSAPLKERKIRSTFPMFPFKITESFMNKPTKIMGIAMKTGTSRNKNYYPEDKVIEFGKALIEAPIYGEHVSVFDAIGKVTNTWFERPFLYYEGEIWDEDFADKIRAGVIRHVSAAADYQSMEIVNGRMPVGIPQNAELSLVAVAGVPEANIKVMERLGAQIERRQSPSETLKLGTKWRFETDE